MNAQGTTGDHIAKNAFWLWVAECWHGLFFFILTVLLARTLGDAGYGRFSFAINYATLLGIIVDFGLNPFLIREGARHPQNFAHLLRHALLLRVFLSAIYIALSIGFLAVTKPDSEIIRLVFLMNLWMILYQGTQIFYAHFRAREEMRLEGLGRILFASITVGLCGLFILLGLPLMSYAGAYAIGSTITFVVLSLEFFHRERWSSSPIDFKIFRQLLVQSWPFALSTVFISIYYYMDSVFLGFMGREQALGWYNASYKIILFLLLFAQVMGSVFYPMLSRHAEHPNRDASLGPILKSFVRIQWILSLPIAFGGSIVSHRLLLWIFGPPFANGGALALQILLWTALIVYISTIYAQVLQSHNLQKQTLYAVGIGALLNIILNVLLIPAWSLNGAALATLLSEISVFAMMLYKTRGVAFIPLWSHVLRPLGAALTMSSALVLLPTLPLGAFIAIGIVIYILSLFLFRAVAWSDLEFLRSFFRRNPPFQPKEEPPL